MYPLDYEKDGNFVRADEYPTNEWPQIDSGKYEGVIAVGGFNASKNP